jgi:hypothetical protein
MTLKAHGPSRAFWIFITLAIVLVFGDAFVRAAEPASAVRVSVSATSWTIRILEPTSLQAVLEAICKESQTVCTIAPDFKSDLVVPMSVQGAPTVVLSKLLEGTKVNYSYVPPSLKEAGKLIVDSAPAGPPENNAPSMASMPETQPGAMNETAPSETTEAGMSPSVAEPAMNLPPPTTARSSGFEIPSGSQVLPFMGPHGRFLVAPVGNQNSTVSPFMDARGNFVSIPSNSGTSVSPFLDGNGGFLPVPSNNSGGPALTPFMDKNGNFIPLPSGSR